MNYLLEELPPEERPDEDLRPPDDELLLPLLPFFERFPLLLFDERPPEFDFVFEDFILIIFINYLPV
jgi:hypothetical protein